jgi:hypothetical protein
MKVCAAEGCKNTLSLYRQTDTLCREHGAQKAKRTRRKQPDPGELEAYRRALLEEALVSLIRDPSRWEWASSLEEGCGTGRHDRAKLRARDDNRCSGWMCGAILDAPLPPGSYCSADCKQQTTYIRKAFRRDLERLRSGTVQPCIECGRLMFRRIDSMACSTSCYQRNYQRERQRRLRGYKPRQQEAVSVA